MDGGSTSKGGTNIPIPMDKLPEYNKLGPYAKTNPIKSLVTPYYCFVPKCKNTTKTAPEKMFIHVPSNKKRRDLWATLACRDLKSVSIKSNLTICEDHFDVQNDIDNYMRLKLGFTRTIKIKPDAFPQYFDCQGRSRRPKESTGNSALDKKRRLQLVLEAIRNRDEEIEKEKERIEREKEREKQKQREIEEAEERSSKFLEVTRDRLEAGKYIVMRRHLLDIRCHKSTQTDTPEMVSRGIQSRPLSATKRIDTATLLQTRPQKSKSSQTSPKRRKLLYFSDVYSSSSEDESESDGDDPLFVVNEAKLNNCDSRSSSDSTISDTDEKIK
uniref:THAP-type domain-containing protein n=2 Tax=Cacopsylla melanoneura TaxID=428564 RepID=A0A8D8M7Y4_9HEMI